MKYVLDASVAVKWVLPEPDSAKAIVLRDAIRDGRHDFIAPDTFSVEVAHALTRAERKGLIQPPESILKIVDVLTNAPTLRPYLPFLPRAVEMSSHYRIGVYDCLYLALAEQEQCELVTADAKLVKALQGYFPQVVELAAMS